MLRESCTGGDRLSLICSESGRAWTVGTGQTRFGFLLILRASFATLSSAALQPNTCSGIFGSKSNTGARSIQAVLSDNAPDSLSVGKFPERVTVSPFRTKRTAWAGSKANDEPQVLNLSPPGATACVAVVVG